VVNQIVQFFVAHQICTGQRPSGHSACSKRRGIVYSLGFGF